LQIFPIATFHVCQVSVYAGCESCVHAKIASVYVNECSTYVQQLHASVENADRAVDAARTAFIDVH